MRRSNQLKIKTIAEWQTEVHQLAVEKGWWDSSVITYDKHLWLVMCELAEATEEVRNSAGCDLLHWKASKPTGLGIEIADAIIRLLDVMGHAEIDVPLTRMSFQDAAASNFGDWPCLLKASAENIIAEMTRFAHPFTDLIENQEDPWKYNRFLGEIIAFANALCINVEERVYTKHLFNKSRPRKHGKLA